MILNLTRTEVQEILDQNNLGAEVTYIERSNKENPDNYIVYRKADKENSVCSDNEIHIRLISLEIIHYHKKKKDSIEDFILEKFEKEPVSFSEKDIDTDYLTTTFRFPLFTKEAW